MCAWCICVVVVAGVALTFTGGVLTAGRDGKVFGDSVWCGVVYAVMACQDCA